jgi:hypothetical protein
MERLLLLLLTWLTWLTLLCAMFLFVHAEGAQPAARGREVKQLCIAVGDVMNTRSGSCWEMTLRRSRDSRAIQSTKGDVDPSGCANDACIAAHRTTLIPYHTTGVTTAAVELDS